jgi:hypothetical protein
MKMNNLKIWALSLSIFGALTFVSCKKDNSDLNQQDEIEADVALAEADAEQETIFNDLFDDVMGVNDEVGVGGTGMFGRSATGNLTDENGRSVTNFPCANVTIAPLGPGFPKTVTIDFGAGCTGPGGHTRSGKIIIVYTNRLMIPGAKATTTFVNFYIDSIHVEGTKIIENQSSLTERKFNKKVINGKLTKPNGNYSQWNSNKTIAQVQGIPTPLPFDDVFAITGFANGIVKKGNRLVQWQSEIERPLVKKFTCRWITNGIVSMRKNQSAVARLDYGAPNNGDCDNKAALTINGNTTLITLH